jgi:tRNA A-37 threonylcarbamoyl transferase component Bud32/tetratricopeptide (TPR) repeat protein
MTTSEPSQDRWIGKVVAEKFRLDALIGEGAMGRVYRGEQLNLGKPVAIKVLHKHLGGDPRIAKRFHREAKAASRLSHPNSLSIIDFGEASDGTLFIAMELLEGEVLQAIIDHDAPLTPARIGSLMVQTLRALDEAHHAGIIHRDLKPENVLVLKARGGMGERVKVCDFGIAKITESEGKSTAITKDGYVCGTPEYMAPEQARGDAIDLRADLYSAGVMLYQMLCGRVPFVAESALGIITRHIMEDPVPPRRMRRAWGIPRSLEAIALKALAKEPDKRFATAAEMADAIERAVRELGAQANERLGHGSFARDIEPEKIEPAPSTDEAIAKAVPARAHGKWWIGALLVASAVLAFGVWLWVNDDPPPEVAPVAQRPIVQEEPVTVDPPPVIAPPAPVIEPPVVEPPVVEPPVVAAAERQRPIVPSRPSRAERGPELAQVARPEPEPEPALDPGDAAFEDGRRLMLRGDLNGAVARFEEAARAMPSSARVQKELGRAYMRTGNVARGISAYRRYLTLAPDAPDRTIVERIIAQHGG